MGNIMTSSAGKSSVGAKIFCEDADGYLGWIPANTLGDDGVIMWLLDGQAIDGTTVHDGRMYYDATMNSAELDGYTYIPKDISYTDLLGGAGSFENGTLDLPLVAQGFDGGETSEASTTTVRTGSYSWHLVVDAAYEGIKADNLTIVEGERYRASAWVYVVSGTVIIRTASLANFNGMNSSGALSSAKTQATGVWEYIWFEGIAQESVSTCDVLVQSDGAAEFHIDDFKVEHLDTPTISLKSNDIASLLNSRQKSPNILLSGDFLATDDLTNGESPVAGNGWSGTNWTIDTDNHYCTHTTGNTSSLYCSGAVAPMMRELVTVEFTITNRTAGSVVINLGSNGQTSSNFDANGAFSYTGVWDTHSNGTLYFTPTSDFDGSIGPVAIHQHLPGVFANDDNAPTGLVWEDLDNLPRRSDMLMMAGGENKSNLIFYRDLPYGSQKEIAREIGAIKEHYFGTTTPLQAGVKIENTGSDNATFTIAINGNRFYNNLYEILSDIRSMPEAYHNEPVYKKAWRYVVKNHIYDQDFTGNKWRVWPTTALNSVGWSQCNGYAELLVLLWRGLGYVARTQTLVEHAVAEVYVTDHWEMYDASVGVYYYDTNGVTVANVDTLVGSLTLITAPVNPIRPTTSIAYDSSVAAHYASNEVMSLMFNGEFDHPSNITLPPGGYIIIGGKYGTLVDIDTNDCEYRMNAKIVLPVVDGFRLRWPMFVQNISESTGSVKILNRGLDGGTYSIGETLTTKLNGRNQSNLLYDFIISATSGTEIIYVLNPQRYRFRTKNCVDVFGDVHNLSISTIDVGTESSMVGYTHNTKIPDLGLFY